MRFSRKLTLTLATAVLAVSSTGISAKDAPACKTGTRAQNVAIAKNFYVAYNTGDAALMEKTLAPDFISYPVMPGEPTGAKVAIERMKFARATFDPTVENVEFIAEGNRVVVRSNIKATHKGPFVGLAPTNRPVMFDAIDIHTICNGRITIGYHEENWLAVLFQLGVLPVKP